MTPETAETLALQALTYIATDEKAFEGFLNLTGLSVTDVRQRASDPELQGAVLDFLLQDEKRLVAFCESCDLAPEEPARARALLPGGDVPHYT